MKWVDGYIDSRAVRVCKQIRLMECGIACTAMMLNRRLPNAPEYEDIPKLPGQLKYDNINGVLPGDLWAYIYEQCGKADLHGGNQNPGTLDSFTAALRKASKKNPAIVILEGHYVFCEGPLSNPTSGFVVLDPKGGRCLVAKLKAGVKMFASSGNSTFEATVEGLITTRPLVPKKKT